MKQPAHLTLATLLTLALATGCSSDTASPSGTSGNDTASSGGDATQSQNSSDGTPSTEPIEVTLWHYYAGNVEAGLQAIVDDFNATVGNEQNITVTAIAKATIAEMEAGIVEAAQGVIYADVMPDLFLAYPDKILELQAMDIVADLGDYLTPDDIEGINKAFLEDGYVDGMQAIFPVVKSTELLMINATTWAPFAQETGCTYDDLSTWEGIAEVATIYYDYTDALTPDIPNDGKALIGIDSLQNYVSVSSKQLGVDIFDGENHQAVLDPDVLGKVFNFYIEQMALGLFAKNANFCSDDVRSGDTIGYIGSSASIAYFPSWIEVNGEKVDIEMQPLPYPTFEGATPTVVSQGAGMALSKSDPQTEAAAVMFLRFFTENDMDFAINGRYIPVGDAFGSMSDDQRTQTLQSYDFLSDSHIQAYQLVADQINDNILYRASEFIGSYQLRIQLEDKLKAGAATAMSQVPALREGGLDKDAILEALQLDTQFQELLNAVQVYLTSQNVSYR